MTIRMWIATAAWLSLVVGFLLRKDRSRHVPLMLGGIFTDIFLVLYLEITKRAVEKALQFDLTLFQMTHIGFSTCALILYFPVLYFGFRLVRGAGDASTLLRHKQLAVTALIFRTCGFVFMFSMWKD